MKLGFTNLACPDWTLEQTVESARRYGYEGIELRLLDGEVLPPTLDPVNRRRVKAICLGLPIICVDTSIKVAQPDAEQRAAQIRDGLAFLELAADWESPFIRVFGGPPPNTAESEAIRAASECLAPLAARGNELGVSVLLETHDAFAQGRTVAAAINNVSGAVGALWDTLHPFRLREALPQTLTALAGKLRHVHIKDGHRPADDGPEWPLSLLGEGDVPIEAILKALHSANYDGWLSVEWEKKWHPEIPEPEIALPQHADLLRSYLQNL